MVPWIRPLANSHLASKSHPDGLNKWDEKGNGRFDQKKKKKEKKGGEEYPATAGRGVPRESQPVFQASCHADTSLPGTVTFGVVPLLCISTVSWIASTVLWNLLDSLTLSRILLQKDKGCVCCILMDNCGDLKYFSSSQRWK